MKTRPKPRIRSVDYHLLLYGGNVFKNEEYKEGRIEKEIFGFIYRL
jgi:hypothetical protein